MALQQISDKGVFNILAKRPDANLFNIFAKRPDANLFCVFDTGLRVLFYFTAKLSEA
jgi:hypothetical protein